MSERVCKSRFQSSQRCAGVVKSRVCSRSRRGRGLFRPLAGGNSPKNRSGRAVVGCNTAPRALRDACCTSRRPRSSLRAGCCNFREPFPSARAGAVRRREAFPSTRAGAVRRREAFPSARGGAVRRRWGRTRARTVYVGGRRAIPPERVPGAVMSATGRSAGSAWTHRARGSRGDSYATRLAERIRTGSTGTFCIPCLVVVGAFTIWSTTSIPATTFANTA